MPDAPHTTITRDGTRVMLIFDCSAEYQAIELFDTAARGARVGATLALVVRLGAVRETEHG